MPRTVKTGIEAIKNDPIVSSLPIDIAQKQSLDLRYEFKQLSTQHQIQRVPGGNIEIEYPVENANVLSGLKLIESQFAAHNEISEVEDELVDTAICQAMSTCLAAENVDLPADSIRAARIRALIFGQARGMQHTTEVLDYLEANPQTVKLLGFSTAESDGIASPSTFYRERREFGMAREPVQHAICRLRHTLFRNGIVPESLTEIGYTAGQPIPPDSQLLDQLRYQELINWSEVLLRRLVDGVSFGRASNRKYTPREIIATMAHVALHDGFSRGTRIAQWHYQNDIISPNRIRQILRENLGNQNFMLAKRGTESLGKQLNRNLFQFAADEIGCFQRPLDIAIDPTWISIGDADPEKVPGTIGNITLKGDADAGFLFPTAVSFTSGQQFALGVKIITVKSQRPNAFRKLLSRITDFADIGWLCADRGLDGRKTIDLFRKVADKKWIIRIRNNKNMIDSDTFRQLMEVGKAQITVNGAEVNVFATEVTPSSPFRREPDDNLLLMSDQPLEETDPRYLTSIYAKRWSVETFIREIKHDFGFETPKNHALEHLFLLDLASVFYNIYKIIHQALSPLYGLPLKPTYYEVLQGLVESTFQRRQQLSAQRADL